MYLYVLSSVLLNSLVFFVLTSYLSLCSEFRVAHFFSFFVLSCYVSLCSVFRVAHFFSCYASSCYVSLCSVFRVAHFFSFFALSCYISLCSKFHVAHFFSFFVLSCYVSVFQHKYKLWKEQHGTQNIKIHNRKTIKTIEMSNTELRIYRYITGQHKKKLKKWATRNSEHKDT
jgi:hypothetical protein